MAIDPHKAAVRDRLWQLLEAEPEVTSRVRVGNRARLTTPAGWLKATMNNGGAGDFPRISVGPGRFTHSAYSYGATLAVERPTFVADGYAFDVRRTADFVVVLQQRLPTDEADDELEEAVQLAVLKGGPRLGLPVIVTAWGPLTAAQEVTETNPVTGKREGQQILVTRLTVPVVMTFAGRELLAGR